MASSATSSSFAVFKNTFFLAVVLVHALCVVTDAASLPLLDSRLRPSTGATVLYPSLATPPPFIPAPQSTRIPFIKPIPGTTEYAVEGEPTVTTTSTEAPLPAQAVATIFVGGQGAQAAAPVAQVERGRTVSHPGQTMPLTATLVATPTRQAPAPQHPAPASTVAAAVTSPTEGISYWPPADYQASTTAGPTAAAAVAAPPAGEVGQSYQVPWLQPTFQQPAPPQGAAVAVAAPGAAEAAQNVQPQPQPTLQQAAPAPTTYISVTVPEPVQSFQPQEPEPQPVPASAAVAAVAAPATGEGGTAQPQGAPAAAVAVAAPVSDEPATDIQPQLQPTLQQTAPAPTTVISVTVPAAGGAVESFQPPEPEPQAAAVAVAAPATGEVFQSEGKISEKSAPAPAAAAAVAAPATQAVAATPTQHSAELQPAPETPGQPNVLITLAVPGGPVEEPLPPHVPFEHTAESTTAQGAAVAVAAPSIAEVQPTPVQEVPRLPAAASVTLAPAPQTDPKRKPLAAAVVTIPEDLEHAASFLDISVPQPVGSAGQDPAQTTAQVYYPTSSSSTPSATTAVAAAQTPVAILISSRGGTPAPPRPVVPAGPGTAAVVSSSPQAHPAPPSIASPPGIVSPTMRVAAPVDFAHVAHDAPTLSTAAPAVASVSTPGAAAAVVSPRSSPEQPKAASTQAQLALPIITSAESVTGPPAVETEKLQEIHVKVSKVEKPEPVTAAELTGPFHVEQAAACDVHLVETKSIRAGLGMLYYYNTDAVEEFHSVNLILPDGKNFRAKIEAVVRDPPPSEEKPKPKSIVHLAGGYTLELGLDGVTLKDEEDEEVASWEAEAVLYPVILEEVTIREAAAVSATPVTSVSHTSTSTVVPQEAVQKAVIAVETETITSSAAKVVPPSPPLAAAMVPANVDAAPDTEGGNEAPAGATAVAAVVPTATAAAPPPSPIQTPTPTAAAARAEIGGSSKKRRAGTTGLRGIPAFGNRARGAVVNDTSAAPAALPTATAQRASSSSHTPESTLSLAAATEKSFEEQKKLLASRHPAVLESGGAIKSVRMLAVSRGNVGTVRLSTTGLAAPGMTTFTCVFRTGIYGDYDPCNTPAVIASNYFRPLTAAVVGGF